MTNKQNNRNIRPQEDHILLFTKNTNNLLPDQHNRREGLSRGTPISIPTVRSSEYFTTITTRTPARPASTSIIKKMKGKNKETSGSTSNSNQSNNKTLFNPRRGSRLITSDDSKNVSSKNGSTNPICISSKEDLILPSRHSRIMNSYSPLAVERKRQNNLSPLSKRKSPRLTENSSTTPDKNDHNRNTNRSNSISSTNEVIIVSSPELTISSKFNEKDDKKYNESSKTSLSSSSPNSYKTDCLSSSPQHEKQKIDDYMDYMKDDSYLDYPNLKNSPLQKDKEKDIVKNNIDGLFDDLMLSPDNTSTKHMDDLYNNNNNDNNKLTLYTNDYANIPPKLEYPDEKLQDLSIDSDNSNNNYQSKSNINIGSTSNGTDEDDFFSAHSSTPKSIPLTQQNTNDSTSLDFFSDDENNKNKKPTSPKASTPEPSITKTADSPLKTEKGMELCTSNDYDSLTNDNNRYQLRRKKKVKKPKVIKPEDELLFTYPSKNSKNAISIYVRDQYKLEPETFLNDSIIDFYIKWSHDKYSTNYTGLSLPSVSDSKLVNDVHVFNSFFYTRITQTRTRVISEEIYAAVQNWTSGIDLFSKKYLIIPVNEDNHWYLVLISNLGLCIPKSHPINVDQDEILSEESTSNEKSTIYILDSLNGKHEKCVKNVIKYLSLEAKYKHDIEFGDFIRPNIQHPSVPRQDNVFDCGIYLLHFVELFMKSTQQFIETLKKDNPDDYFWRTDDLKYKRNDILSLFNQLKNKKTD